MSRRLLRRLRLGAALAVLAVFTAAFVDFRGIEALRYAAQALARLQFGPAFVALTTGSVVLGLGLLAVLVLTVLFGRVYCSTLCPLGLMQDAIARIARGLRVRRTPLRFARASHALRYGVLAAVVITVAAGAGEIAFAHADPYSHFGRIVSGLLRPIVVACNNLLVPLADAAGSQALFRVEPPWPGAGILGPALLVLVVLAVLVTWRGRFFCNTLCPVGTVLGLISRHAAFRLRIDVGACTKCAACLRACKSQCLDLRAGVIDASRCVACFNCLDACTERGLGYRFAWRKRSAADAGRTAETPSAPRDPSRRVFLAGALALAPAALRAADAGPDQPRIAVAPPGAGGVERFLERCTGCQLCVSTCLTGVLRPAFLEYGFPGMMKPRLDFASSYCNYDCQRCGEVCPTGAIARLALPDKKLVSIGVARLTQSLCIVEARGTDCAACSEHCPTKAVETVPFRDNLRLPQINEDLCIGCGACEFACPVRPQRAIAVSARAEHTRARQPAEEPPAALPPSGGFPF